MTDLARLAASRRIGGQDIKLALICLCMQAKGSGPKANITAQEVEDACRASEMTRKAFSGALKVLRDLKLIGVNRTKNLAGEPTLLSIDIDLSRASASDDAEIEMTDGSIQSQVWADGLSLFRSVGKPDAVARPLIGRLIRAAGGDLYKLRDAMVSARRSGPEDPFTYIQGILAKEAKNGEGLGAAFERRARGVDASDDYANRCPP